MVIMEKRQWVRLTRVCNNRCVFCLDKDCQDGSMVCFEQIVDELRQGVKEQATRAVLSGGDPTIHPRFFDIVSAATGMGYKKIQVITNGRIFAYGKFLSEAVSSGVHEITFSMHGHTRELHDAQTGVKGSFAQSVKGLLNALRTEKLIVNVDVVVNKMNYKFLKDIVEFFFRLGIREFDLLCVVPFGAAWENKDDVLFSLEDLKTYLDDAIQFASGRGIRLWTNRLHPEYLEGNEDMIQDPIKILDEVRGRKEIFEDYLSRGRIMPCYGERCRFCFMETFCCELKKLKEDLSAGKVDSFLACRANMHKIPLAKKFHPEYFILHNVNGDDSMFSGLEKEQVVVRVDRIDENMSWEKGRHYEILINKDTEPFILDEIQKIGSRHLDISICPQTYLSLEDSRCHEVDIPEFFNKIRSLPEEVCVRDVPPCIYTTNVLKTRDFYDLGIFHDDFSVDIFWFAAYFITQRYRVKSLGCRACIFFDRCPGLHVNTIRSFGFRLLKPVLFPDGDIMETPAFRNKSG